MKILKESFYTWNAEGRPCVVLSSNLLAETNNQEYYLCWTVVFITSNYIGNSEIMEGCKEAGIPAFGTLWDFVSGRVLLFSALVDNPLQ